MPPLEVIVLALGAALVVCAVAGLFMLGAVLKKVQVNRQIPVSVKFAKTEVRNPDLAPQTWREAQAAVGVDLDLLRRFQAGNVDPSISGLKRAGFLSWKVTPQGQDALAREKEWG